MDFKFHVIRIINNFGKNMKFKFYLRIKKVIKTQSNWK